MGYVHNFKNDAFVQVFSNANRNTDTLPISTRRLPLEQRHFLH
jgi:hypothetical protein